MTEAEKNEIVGLVMTEISSQAVDFDITTEQPQANDLLTAVRETESGGYRGVTIKWDDVARIATELANQAVKKAEQAKTDAVNAKNIAQEILTGVQNNGTEIMNFVATSKSEIETQKNEAVETVRSVYRNDLNAESTARQTADNTLQQNIDSEALTRAEADTALGARIDSETTTRESEVAELERVNAIQKYEIKNLKAKSEGKLYRTETVEAEAYALDVPSSVAPYAEVQRIGGKSVVWNQINNLKIEQWDIIQFVVTNLESGYTRLTYVNGTETFGYILLPKSVIAGHTYLIFADLSINDDSNIYSVWAKPSDLDDTINFKNGKLVGKANSSGRPIIGFTVKDKSIETSIDIKDIMIVDLTKMFGYGNEPTLDECKKIFSEDYYPYDEGSIKSFPVKRVKSVGKNLVNFGAEFSTPSNTHSSNTSKRTFVKGTLVKGLANNNYFSFANIISYSFNNDIVSIQSKADYGVAYVTNLRGKNTLFFKCTVDDTKNMTYIMQYKSDGSFIDSKYVNANKYETSEEAEYILVLLCPNFRFNSEIVIFAYPQLEKGSIATDYVPYKESVIDVSSLTTDLKSAGSVHDEWSNGKKIIRVGERAYTSGDESESGYITDGATTYYPLDTPTEETVPEISNYIQVEGGGTLTFESDDTVHMPVPSTDRFVVDLTSTTEETT